MSLTRRPLHLPAQSRVQRNLPDPHALLPRARPRPRRSPRAPTAAPRPAPASSTAASTSSTSATPSSPTTPTATSPPSPNGRSAKATSSLRKNLRAMYLGLYAAELCQPPHRGTRPPPRPLRPPRSRPSANSHTDRHEESFLAFQLDLLRETGYLPELSLCASCGAPSPTARPLLLPHPRRPDLPQLRTPPQRLTLDARLLGIMQLFSTNGTARLPILTRHQPDPINKLLAEYIEHTLGRRLRLPKYVVGKIPMPNAE